jgi:hypothetical protein
MKTNTLQSIALNTITYACIVLFTYAAVSKGLDFENFQVQLGQSPLLSAFAGFISYAVIITELLIVICLSIKQTRLIALLGSFMLMTAFTTYIVIIINFSPFVPCSCGGILDKMGWNSHLIFNIIFAFLAAIAFCITTPEKSIVTNSILIKRLYMLLFGAFISISVIAFMFLLSENMMKHRNNFTRRFPHHPAILKHERDLMLNSYYIAGLENSSVYLGNTSAPLTVTEIDTSLNQTKLHYIKLPKTNLKYHSLKIIVHGLYFYVYDGKAPFILRGLVHDWKAQVWSAGDAYFTSFTPVNSSMVAIRAQSSQTFESVLGTIKKKDTIEVVLNPKLLTKQIDGFFDTDGMLLYNREINKLIYTYYYRNEYFMSNVDLKKEFTGKTIDTTSIVKIKVVNLKSRKESKIASPPITVNKNTATSGNYLFVHAGLVGQFEPLKMWSKASIIDTYNITKGTYEYSFYINDKKGKKLRDFKVRDDLIVCLNGNFISTYRLVIK